MESKNRSIFEKIINRELPAEILYENEKVIAIKDIAPKAPIHILIIPKKPIPTIQEMEEADFYLLGEIIKVAHLLAKKYNLDKTGYRLLVNHGPDSGQVVFHIHFHLLGGAPLGSL